MSPQQVPNPSVLWFLYPQQIGITISLIQCWYKDKVLGRNTNTRYYYASENEDSSCQILFEEFLCLIELMAVLEILLLKCYAHCFGTLYSHTNDWPWIVCDTKLNFEVNCACFLPFANKASVANWCSTSSSSQERILGSRYNCKIEGYSV